MMLDSPVVPRISTEALTQLRSSTASASGCGMTFDNVKVRRISRTELLQIEQERSGTPGVTKSNGPGSPRAHRARSLIQSSNRIVPEPHPYGALASDPEKGAGQKRVPHGPAKPSSCCLLLTGFIIVALLLAGMATALAMSILSKTTAHSTLSTTSITTTSVTTVTTATETTTTIISTTSSTSTSATTSTTVTTTTTTTSVTTSTTQTSTTTATTTTTTPACASLRWNLTGIRVAGTGVSGDTPDKLRQPRCLFIDANDVLFICDYNNNRIQKWIIGASNGTTVTGNINGNRGTDSNELDHPMGITFDKYGYMYVADYDNHRVQRYSPNSSNGTMVAGTGSPGVATTNLNQPTAVFVDDNLNMFITENGNNRLVFWPFNSTNSTILINGRSGGAASGELSNPYDLIVVNSSGNQVYMSDATKDRVQLWTFGAGNANVTFSTTNTVNLNIPRQIRMDPFGNMYVADSLRQRVVMFCSNSIIGFPIVGRNTTSTPTFDDPSGIAFDSQLNLYVASSNNHEVLKYVRL